MLFITLALSLCKDLVDLSERAPDQFIEVVIKDSLPPKENFHNILKDQKIVIKDSLPPKENFHNILKDQKINYGESVDDIQSTIVNKARKDTFTRLPKVKRKNVGHEDIAEEDNKGNQVDDMITSNDAGYKDYQIVDKYIAIDKNDELTDGIEDSVYEGKTKPTDYQKVVTVTQTLTKRTGMFGNSRVFESTQAPASSEYKETYKSINTSTTSHKPMTGILTTKKDNFQNHNKKDNFQNHNKKNLRSNKTKEMEDDDLFSRNMPLETSKSNYSKFPSENIKNTKTTKCFILTTDLSSFKELNDLISDISSVKIPFTYRKRIVGFSFCTSFDLAGKMVESLIGKYPFINIEEEKTYKINEDEIKEYSNDRKQEIGNSDKSSPSNHLVYQHNRKQDIGNSDKSSSSNHLVYQHNSAPAKENISSLIYSGFISKILDIKARLINNQSELININSRSVDDKQSNSSFISSMNQNSNDSLVNTITSHSNIYGFNLINMGTSIKSSLIKKYKNLLQSSPNSTSGINKLYDDKTIVSSEVPLYLFRMQNMGNIFFNNYLLDNFIFRFFKINLLIKYFYSHSATYTGRNVHMTVITTPKCNNSRLAMEALLTKSKYSLSPNAQVEFIEAIDCNGNIKLSSILNILDNLVLSDILILPFYGPHSEALNNAVKKISQTSLVLVPAGDEGDDACKYSPNDKSIFKIGSSTKHGYVSNFSNKGSCIDTYVLGEDILTLSGSAYSSAIFASILATYKEMNPHATKQEIHEYLAEITGKNEYHDKIIKLSSPNFFRDAASKNILYSWKYVLLFNLILAIFILFGIFLMSYLHMRILAYRADQEYFSGSLRSN